MVIEGYLLTNNDIKKRFRSTKGCQTPLNTDFREPFNNDNSTLLERRFIAWVLRKSSHIKVVIA